MSKGAEISAQNHYGDNPMHYACLLGKLDIVQMLLAGGADASVDLLLKASTKPHSACTTVHGCKLGFGDDRIKFPSHSKSDLCMTTPVIQTFEHSICGVR